MFGLKDKIVLNDHDWIFLLCLLVMSDNDQSGEKVTMPEVSQPVVS